MQVNKQTCNSIIELDNGANYEIIESVPFIESLLIDDFIKNESFITFHFSDGYECKIKKNKISAFYENAEVD
jgi:hypothetical protein